MPISISPSGTKDGDPVWRIVGDRPTPIVRVVDLLGDGGAPSSSELSLGGARARGLVGEEELARDASAIPRARSAEAVVAAEHVRGL